jgi:hypothetical protein
VCLDKIYLKVLPVRVGIFHGKGMRRAAVAGRWPDAIAHLQRWAMGGSAIGRWLAGAGNLARKGVDSAFARGSVA